MCDEPSRPCTTVSGLLPPACCPANGLTLPSFRLLLYLFMPADMAAISFGPNIIIGSFALIANVSLCTSQANTVFNTQPNREQSSIGLGYPCDQKCKKLSETTIAFSNVKLLPRPSRHEDIRSAHGFIQSRGVCTRVPQPRHCRKNAGELPRTAPASDLPHRHAMANHGTAALSSEPSGEKRTMKRTVSRSASGGRESHGGSLGSNLPPPHQTSVGAVGPPPRDAPPFAAKAPRKSRPA